MASAQKQARSAALTPASSSDVPENENDVGYRSSEHDGGNSRQDATDEDEEDGVDMHGAIRGVIEMRGMGVESRGDGIAESGHRLLFLLSWRRISPETLRAMG